MLSLKYSIQYLILALIAASTIVIGLIPDALWGRWRFESFPLHSAVEATGALTAVLMAGLLLQRKEEDAWRLQLAGIGFLGMGLLDLFHSAVTPGHGFVILRSAAHFWGGIWFAWVCVPRRPLQDAALKKWLPWAVGAGCVLLGIWTLVARETLPVMVEDGQFTLTAVALNVTGGMLFLAAAARFVVDFHRSGRMEFYLFACIALLLGLGGVLFKYSMLWDDVWWTWHLLRLAAYFIALGIIYRVYVTSAGELERHVVERTAALTKTTEQLQQEITERKQMEEALQQNEERFRTLTIATTQMVWVTNAQGEVAEDIPTWRAFTGQSEEDIKGWGWTNALHPDDVKRTSGLWQQAVNTRTLYQTEYRIRRHDGEYRHFSVCGVPVLEKDGGIREWIGTCTDITERKRADEAIKTLNENLMRYSEKLEAANEDLEGFSYSVSHDLRAPLRAVDGFSRILREDYAGKLDDEGRRLLTVVRDNTGKMGRLIDDILAFSRAGRRELALSEINMNDLVRAIFDELKPAAGGRTVNLEIAPLPPACADQAMIRQVLFNLFSNAIKFTRTRDIAAIEVSGRVVGEEQIYLVKDNGVGFDPRYTHKLFGVFQRLHGAEEFEGTGIGLAIVKRIIDKHGGRVWAESKPGEGAAFYFSLPGRKPDATDGGPS